MKNKRLFLLPATIAAGFNLLAPSLHAAPLIWDAGGVDTNWSTQENWNPDDADVTGDDVTFNLAGALASGTTNTVSASASVSSLSYSFEDATLVHTTSIAAGQTLDVTGSFLLASGATAATPTNVTLAGATGTLTVIGTSFQVGQTTPTAGSNTNSLDMTGLGTLTANLGATGIFRLGAASVGQFGALTTVKLAATSNITANALGVGDRAGRGGTHTVKLGSTANTLNVNTISVGPAGSGGRGNGELSFETSTGTLKLRAADTTAAVTTMNLINHSFGTNNNSVATANLNGHDVDAQITTLNMARRNGTGSSATGFLAQATLSFDQGTLEVATANMGVNANSGLIGKVEAIINIGGGTASFGTINMANNASGDTSKVITANLNLTGGTTTVTGDIIKLGTTNATATVALKGGTLDMTAGNLGDVTNPVTLTLESGIFKNIAEINGGGSITKTTAGSLTLSGANTFTGAVSVTTGELKITDSGSLGTGTKNITVANSSSLNLDGTAGNITLASELSLRPSGLAILNSAGDNVINGTVRTVAGNGTATVTSNGGSLTLAGNVDSGATGSRGLALAGTSTGANTVSGVISNGTATPLTVTKSGLGTWTLTNDTNSFGGTVSINEGTLKITKSGALGAGTKNINIPIGGTLALDGTAGAIALPADKTLRTAGAALLSTAGNNVVSGPIALVGGAIFTSAISDAGTLELAGAISSEVVTTNRRLELGGASTGANLVSGPISDGNAKMDVLKNGSGNWALTSATNTYTGNTTVQEGTLSVSTPNFADNSTVAIGTLAAPGVAFLNLPNAGDDVVATLSINGVVQTAGLTYGNSASVLPVIATTVITGPGTITVAAAPANPYAIWADTFLPGNNVSNPAGDNDNDGLVNQQEFAFGLSPISGSSVNPILVQLDKTAGTFTYQRRAASGLTYKILTSTDLIAWPEDTTATQAATLSGSNETVVVTLTGAKPLTATKLFVRVAAQ